MTRVSKAVRKQVWERAKGRCEYCRRPEATTAVAFHVDHIIPVKRHNGSPGVENLAWSCAYCNRNKKTDVASFDLITGELVPLFNPRRQAWEDHFSMNGAVIDFKTSIGEVTIRLLNMNNPEFVEARQLLIQLGLW